MYKKKVFSDPLNLLLIVSVLFIVLTRIYGLDHREFRDDEIFSTQHANPSLSFPELISGLEGEVTNPLLYQINLWAWMKLFGESLWAARSLSLCYAMLGVLTIYFLSRELFNKKVAVYTIFALSVTFKHIFMAQEARSYAMFFFFSILSFYLFSLLIKREEISKKIYFFYILSNFFMLNIHYYGYPLVLAQGSFLLFSYFFTGTEKKRAYAISFCLACICAASIPNLFKIMQASTISHFWIEDKTWYEKVFYFGDFFHWAYRRALTLIFGLIFFWAYYTSFSGRYKGEKYMSSIYLISFWIILSFTLPTVYSFLKTDILLHRYFLGTLPGIQIIIALGITRIPEKFSKPLVYISFILLVQSLITKNAYVSQYLW